MKATLSFDLDNPDDRMAHARCVKALDMALCLHRLSEDYRRLARHSDDRPASWESIATMLHDHLDDAGVNLDDLIS